MAGQGGGLSRSAAPARRQAGRAPEAAGAGQGGTSSALAAQRITKQTNKLIHIQAGSPAPTDHRAPGGSGSPMGGLASIRSGAGQGSTSPRRQPRCATDHQERAADARRQRLAKGAGWSRPAAPAWPAGAVQEHRRRAPAEHQKHRGRPGRHLIHAGSPAHNRSPGADGGRRVAAARQEGGVFGVRRASLIRIYILFPPPPYIYVMGNPKSPVFIGFQR
ncbi:hypothetical protein SAMN04244571_01343 [Azotobacter beijerinckii]|uniref:Uncharacterized protein n=1 Tax=Azotobacter beijerinckii TaxID=170623 RepID=A0A1I0Y336_9GAMM|nr:hypothetical protein SAMN04244571_01343 [Azotobacter beijerinckii]